MVGRSIGGGASGEEQEGRGGGGDPQGKSSALGGVLIEALFSGDALLSAVFTNVSAGCNGTRNNVYTPPWREGKWDPRGGAGFFSALESVLAWIPRCCCCRCCYHCLVAE